MQKQENQNRDWYLFDARDYVLGRLSTEVANLLRGKNLPSFTSNKDEGSYVVVINADKVSLSGKKEEQKKYYKHTGFIGNLKTKTFQEVKSKNPESIIIKSISGMLPKNKLRSDFLKRLKIYSGSSHPHQNIKFVNK